MAAQKAALQNNYAAQMAKYEGQPAKQGEVQAQYNHQLSELEQHKTMLTAQARGHCSTAGDKSLIDRTAAYLIPSAAEPPGNTRVPQDHGNAMSNYNELQGIFAKSGHKLVPSARLPAARLLLCSRHRGCRSSCARLPHTLPLHTAGGLPRPSTQHDGHCPGAYYPFVGPLKVAARELAGWTEFSLVVPSFKGGSLRAGRTHAACA